MKITNREKEPKSAVLEVPGVTIQNVISDTDGAENFFMRLFEMAPGVKTEPHAHDYEHEIYILEGQGTVIGEGEPKAINGGDILFIPANERHTFRNDGPDKLVWICLIPAPKT
ncbi:MAG: cupin domain-containing protein [Deltaproteobacteria bacterium]|nr:cupin domain-containing protein [Deltaproteobacteria bacterium]